MKTRQRFWSLRLGKQWILVGLLGLSLLAGCATPSQNPSLYTGAGLGAALGAGIGAATNHTNPWRGAGIGALLGATPGGVAGEIYGQSNPLSAATAGVLSAGATAATGVLPPQQGNYQQAPYYGPPPS